MGTIQPMDQPTRIVLEHHDRLLLTWQGGEVTELAADVLRGSCPCAACKESPTGWVVPTVTIRTVEQAGAYGLRILFDGHESGIFSYDYLRLLGSRDD